jgi:hypothetical protein
LDIKERGVQKIGLLRDVVVEKNGEDKLDGRRKPMMKS